jgi:hypothetical protein
MNVRTPFEFSPAPTFPRFTDKLFSIGLCPHRAFCALTTLLFSASSADFPKTAYLIENTRLKTLVNHFVFNRLRIAHAYISRKSSVHIKLRIGYRGCTSPRASGGAEFPEHAFAQREPIGNYRIFNWFRTLLHSFPGSPLLSICSPIQPGVYPRSSNRSCQ